MQIFCVKSVKIYTGQKNLHGYICGIRDKYEVCESDKSRRFSKSTQKFSGSLCYWHCFVLSSMNVKDLCFDQAPWTPFQQDLSTQKRLVRHPDFCLRRGFQCTGCYDIQKSFYKHNILHTFVVPKMIVTIRGQWTNERFT